MLNEAIPTNIGTSGASFAFSIRFEDNSADATVAIAAINTHCHLFLKCGLKNNQVIMQKSCNIPFVSPQIIPSTQKHRQP